MMELAEGPKRKLLDAALRVIRAQGYAGSSVDDICREAGVTKGSFFHHFKGKDDLDGRHRQPLRKCPVPQRGRSA